VTIRVGNFQDIEPELDEDFDLICLIGVFEYGISYIGGERPFESFLKILQKHVKRGGRIVIAIENRLGLKYFAGCMEDHLGSYFSGITNYVNGGVVRTFSRPGLERIFADCDIPAEEIHFYYPYPDYKFMTTLYSDKKLPGKGELSNNLRNFDRDRILKGKNLSPVKLNIGSPVLDTVGHGTFIAGIIGATKGNGIGIAGMAPGVTFAPIKLRRS